MGKFYNNTAKYEYRKKHIEKNNNHIQGAGKQAVIQCIICDAGGAYGKRLIRLR